MTLNRNSVELLAPAGTWEAFIAAIDSGADAVYLGGKHFNMRVHRNDFNFDDETLKKVVETAHGRGVKIYVTLNNLISPEEIPLLEKYLHTLGEIKPDAILVQDFAVVNLIRKMNLDIPIHASVMMNTHNFEAVEVLKKFGITRVVVGREMSLKEVSLLKERTGIEIEYFMHGDMCVAESGQCIHSGVVFGQSGNRGRCLKPCRWAYKLIDENTGEILNDTSHKLALNDMCMYRNIPDLIQAGVYSFKIEGRMRPPEFIRRIVSTYRRAIDAYIADPTGYEIDREDWKDLYENRVREFTTTFAFNPPTVKDFGLTGEREPRFFSKPVAEPDFDDSTAKEIFDSEREIKNSGKKPGLTVRVSSVESAKAAVKNGADTIRIGGEVFRPLKSWKIDDFKAVEKFAHAAGVKVILNTPRTTSDKDLSEISELAGRLKDVKFDGISVGNIGALNLAKKIFDLPIYADLSFNLFNEVAADFLKSLGVVKGVASQELSFSQLRTLVENSEMPIEVIVHGSIESMICDHDFVKLYAPGFDKFATPEFYDRRYALEDTAGEIHSLRIDNFGRQHIYFGKDLCLLPYVEKFFGADSLRIEAQDYSPEVVGLATKIYKSAIDGKDFSSDFEELKKISPRKFGCGVYRFRQSRNSAENL